MMPPAVARLPRSPGVYRLRAKGGAVLYLGRAVNLRHRVASYWGDLGDRKRLAAMVALVSGFDAGACDSEHEAAWLERNLLEREIPTWNRALGGQEVPVYIRLDPRPASPGLTVLHEPRSTWPARDFGPYLGGTKVRLAVTALRRLLPVAYAADGLTGSGQDMARVLGVDPGDRERLLQRLGLVLDRDPAAVASLRTELERRRQSAAAALAFERAADLHAEMAAIEWVVAEQKVAVLEPSDLDVYGWVDGVLVQFEIRGGRFSEWQYRRCSAATAGPMLAATPIVWRRFAYRNAALAALAAQLLPEA